MLGFAIVLVTLGIFAVLVTSGVVPERWMDLYVAGGCGIGTVSGGIFVLRCNGKGSALYSLYTGVIMAAVLTLTGVFLYGSLNPARCGVLALTCMMSGAFAGLISRNKTRRRRE